MSKKAGCVVSTEDGFIVEKCNGKIKKICVPGTRSVNGGFSVFGSGGNAGHDYPDIECYCMSEIKKKLRKAKK